MARVALVRILGNDLPARNGQGCCRETFDWLLANEPAYEAVSRVWLLNRLLDDDDRAYYERRARDRDERCIVIPPDVDAVLSADRTAARILAMIGLNHARNRAITDCLEQGFDVVLPFDSRCTFHPAEWDAALERLAQLHEKSAYFLFAQARMDARDAAYGRPATPDEFSSPGAKGGRLGNEYALGFTRRADLLFDEHRPFGHSDKAELLAALDVEGPWQRWLAHTTLKRPARRSAAASRPDGVSYGGVIRVLPTLMPGLDADIDARRKARATAMDELRARYRAIGR